MFSAQRMRFCASMMLVLSFFGVYFADLCQMEVYLRFHGIAGDRDAGMRWEDVGRRILEGALCRIILTFRSGAYRKEKKVFLSANTSEFFFSLRDAPQIRREFKNLGRDFVVLGRDFQISP